MQPVPSVVCEGLENSVLHPRNIRRKKDFLAHLFKRKIAEVAELTKYCCSNILGWAKLFWLNKIRKIKLGKQRCFIRRYRRNVFSMHLGIVLLGSGTP